ncbi:hypothetical protein DFO80_12028 [Rhodobacter sp. 140A]|nr:hypothetical protein DFO80_12028 [Rhodobacter sp. 140A]
MSRALWQAVLARAIDDAVNGVPKVGGLIERSRAKAISEARTLLTTPSDDLEIICAFAGVETDALIERMRARIAEAPNVEELARKPRLSSLSVAAREPQARKYAEGGRKNNGCPSSTSSN